ncbi:hypothetical protein SmJEL517_g00648 [Synchytrium microbalum]|uniref:Rab-GAP TBC domain-containing protein n=1 Tax=Synchytrium microbalum TaxID=1806994 RepID=A0A507CH74_9FUNG|nr:uncharacterized protein SmJEL517_g00648 [Synchytrium microbalum]TPX37416.1 hypothetical protein SmJEL517_g00648 [Synchytrium microbalum]
MEEPTSDAPMQIEHPPPPRKETLGIAPALPQHLRHKPPSLRTSSSGNEPDVMFVQVSIDEDEDQITPIEPQPNSPASPVRSRIQPQGSVTSLTTMDETASIYTTNGSEDNEDSSFLLARLEKDRARTQPATGELSPQHARPTSSLQALSNSLFSSFQAVRDTVVGDGKESLDWDFWGKLMSNFEAVARKHPRVLTRKLHAGIPPAIRGMVWQLMCKGKSQELETTYSNLLSRTSPFEKQIQRDLPRTFPEQEYFRNGGTGQESLFHVIKAYSLFDPEVGYCQGMSFIIGPLLLNMPEEEAFCVLVRLMKNYEFRGLYTPKMEGLSLRLFQFEKLLEEQLPAVNRHLYVEGIKSTMYASQWFMTCFAYRFPLEIVFRILDIIFAEGQEAMFRFAIALLKRNQDTLLAMQFDHLLEYLKEDLFDAYADNVDKLIADATAVKITKARLDKLAKDHEEDVWRNSPESMEREALRMENRRLVAEARKQESMLEQLNREHVRLATQLVEAQVAAVSDKEVIEELQEKLAGLRAFVSDDRNSAEEKVREEMESVMRKNSALIQDVARILDQKHALEDQLADMKHRFAQSENEKEVLQKRWEDLKKSLTAS